jgi:hypothetical protein
MRFLKFMKNISINPKIELDNGGKIRSNTTLFDGFSISGAFEGQEQKVLSDIRYTISGALTCLNKRITFLSKGLPLKPAPIWLLTPKNKKDFWDNMSLFNLPKGITLKESGRMYKKKLFCPFENKDSKSFLETESVKAYTIPGYDDFLLQHQELRIQYLKSIYENEFLEFKNAFNATIKKSNNTLEMTYDVNEGLKEEQSASEICAVLQKKSNEWFVHCLETRKNFFKRILSSEAEYNPDKLFAFLNLYIFEDKEKAIDFMLEHSSNKQTATKNLIEVCQYLDVDLNPTLDQLSFDQDDGKTFVEIFRYLCNNPKYQERIDCILNSIFPKLTNDGVLSIIQNFLNENIVLKKLFARLLEENYFKDPKSFFKLYNCLYDGKAGKYLKEFRFRRHFI